MKKQIILAGVLIVVIAGLVVALTVTSASSNQPAGASSVPRGPGSSSTTPQAPGEVLTLARAASAGRVDLVRQRIEVGDDIDALDEEYAMAPLHHAANLQRADIAEILLEAGADPNVTDATGKSPLHYAANNGAADVAILLIRHGAEGSIAEETFGFTPLHLAAIGGHADVADALLAAGASYEVEDADGVRPSLYAESEGHQDVIDVIRRYHRLRNPPN